MVMHARKCWGRPAWSKCERPACAGLLPYMQQCAGVGQQRAGQEGFLFRRELAAGVCCGVLGGCKRAGGPPKSCNPRWSGSKE